MADILDIATYVLEQTGDTSTMKLQKLVYYSQAQHLVKYGTPLFSNRIEAWANGPVVYDLFNAHCRKYVVNSHAFGRTEPALSLSASEIASIDKVVSILGGYTGAELSDLTHLERPWVDARKGLPIGARSDNEITQDAIKAFYGSQECSNPVFA